MQKVMRTQLTVCCAPTHVVDGGYANIFAGDDHVLVFDNPFKGAMDGDDDEDL